MHAYAIPMLYFNPPPPNYRMPKPNFMKLGMNIMEPEYISTVYFRSPFLQPVCLCTLTIAVR
jgi:hypothetical protein